MSKGILMFVMADEASEFEDTLKSLRLFYDGPVKVYMDGIDLLVVADLKKRFDLDCQVIKAAGISPRILLVRGLRYTPFELTLFVRNGTIFKSFPSTIWKQLDDSGLLFMNTEHILLTDHVKYKRLLKWASIFPSVNSVVNNFKVPIDPRIIGFKKESVFIQSWLDMTTNGEKGGLEKADEDAMQLVAPFFPHLMLPKEHCAKVLK